jgi:hypothetical protein
VHSVRGQSRVRLFYFIEEKNMSGFNQYKKACCVLAAFFMMRYQWTLYKTLEYLNSRRPDLEIRASFFHQLTQLEQKLQKQGLGAKHSTWDDGDSTNPEDK